jgi:hypothetical protein
MNSFIDNNINNILWINLDRLLRWGYKKNLKKYVDNLFKNFELICCIWYYKIILIPNK